MTHIKPKKDLEQKRKTLKFFMQKRKRKKKNKKEIDEEELERIDSANKDYELFIPLVIPARLLICLFNVYNFFTFLFLFFIFLFFYFYFYFYFGLNLEE